MNPTATAQKHLSPYTTDFVKVGFIGQGWIGKNYADDFERRGFSTVRYALEEPYAGNKEKIKDCNIVFIAVPTPTTPEGFDASIVESAVALVGAGKISVIKSTLLPGTTKRIQEKFPDRIVLMSPEFLTEVTAAYDAAHPMRNIIGISKDTGEYRAAAQQVLSVLPKASYESICSSTEGEYIKYGGNNWFYFKVLFTNMLYDLAIKDGCNWEVIRNGMIADPRIGSSHMNPMHQSGTTGGEAHRTLPLYELHMQPVHKGGRGAGGHCFIKDYAAFRRLYQQAFPDDVYGNAALRALEDKNINLLLTSGKDLDLLQGVYGPEPLRAVSHPFALFGMPRQMQWIVLGVGALSVLAGTLDIATRFIDAILK
ncbi:MAG: hypothetical protein KGH79_01475 [Patescibacteria group bacterium]|nr:hypothetical protein [Patescibacteria group bacterium]